MYGKESVFINKRCLLFRRHFLTRVQRRTPSDKRSLEYFPTSPINDLSNQPFPYVLFSHLNKLKTLRAELLANFPRLIPSVVFFFVSSGVN